MIHCKPDHHTVTVTGLAVCASHFLPENTLEYFRINLEAYPAGLHYSRLDCFYLGWKVSASETTKDDKVNSIKIVNPILAQELLPVFMLIPAHTVKKC